MKITHPKHPHLSTIDGYIYIDTNACKDKVSETLSEQGPPDRENYIIKLHPADEDSPVDWLSVRRKSGELSLLDAKFIRLWLERAGEEMVAYGLALDEIEVTGIPELIGARLTLEPKTLIQMQHLGECSKYLGLVEAGRKYPADMHIADNLANEPDPKNLNPFKEQLRGSLAGNLAYLEECLSRWAPVTIVDELSRDMGWEPKDRVESISQQLEGLAESLEVRARQCRTLAAISELES